MKNAIQTEEFERKKSYKWIIIVLIIIVILAVGGFITYYVISHKSKNKVEKKEVVVTPLNTELQDLYAFALMDNYIVALKKDGTFLKIYNLLQGTGNLGNFTTFKYHDKKLYLLYSDNNLYTIDLDKGNKVYELVKYMSLDYINCPDGSYDLPNDIAFLDKTIFINNSNCSVTRSKLDNKTKKIKTDILKKFNKKTTFLEYSDYANSLLVYADNNIYKFNNKTGEITSILDNISNINSMMINSNMLIYSTTINNINSYYLYNLKNNSTGKLLDADKIILYNNSYIYLKDNIISIYKNNKSTEIYRPHYNVLTNLELINKNTLQIVDSTSDLEKQRIVNIDLSTKKYNITYNNNIFTDVEEYSDKK